MTSITWKKDKGFWILKKLHREMHSAIFDEKRWQYELKGKVFFSHGHSNFNVLNKIQDNDGRILLLDVQVDDAAFFVN